MSPLVDFDNDGALDAYEANGAVFHESSSSHDDPFAEPNLLYHGTESEHFFEVQPRGGTEHLLVHTSRGVAYGDLNNDGGVDLVVVNRDAEPYVLFNQVGNKRSWVRFRVLTEFGRDAHGAEISVRVGKRRLHRSVQTGGSYLASHDPRVHFGYWKTNRSAERASEMAGRTCRGVWQLRF